MNCLRCGTEVTPPDVFCPDCQAEMAKHPVPRGVPVVLPSQDQLRRAPRKAYAPPNSEEQLLSLRHRLRRLRIAFVSLCVVCACLLGALFFAYQSLGRDGHAIGQNYQTSTSPASAPSNSEGSAP